MGGLRYHHRKNLSFFVENGRGESFFEFLEKLNQFIKAEGMKQGNKDEFYEQTGPIVLVILDNASYHKRQDIPIENRTIITKYTALFFTSL